ncbi:hypothetical protein CHFL109739_06350 [Chryseobacterium flavum]|uniref:hypothetical protein n=1 Tax=Chryseobacterium flavum TaxID=415851 RepID=UPI000F4D3520|nr:hypothetical protein [Chryseobacterium flavum]
MNAHLVIPQESKLFYYQKNFRCLDSCGMTNVVDSLGEKVCIKFETSIKHFPEMKEVLSLSL